MNCLLLHFDCLLSPAPVWWWWTRDCPRELFVRFWGRETPDKRSNNLDVFLRKNSRQPENINIFGCFTSAQIFMIKINLRHHNPHSVVMTKAFWRQNTNYQIHTDLISSKSLSMKDKHLSLHQNCRINIYICIRYFDLFYASSLPVPSCQIRCTSPGPGSYDIKSTDLKILETNNILAW